MQSVDSDHGATLFRPGDKNPPSWSALGSGTARTAKEKRGVKRIESVKGGDLSQLWLSAFGLKGSGVNFDGLELMVASCLRHGVK